MKPSALHSQPLTLHFYFHFHSALSSVITCEVCTHTVTITKNKLTHLLTHSLTHSLPDTFALPFLLFVHLLSLLLLLLLLLSLSADDGDSETRSCAQWKRKKNTHTCESSILVYLVKTVAFTFTKHSANLYTDATVNCVSPFSGFSSFFSLHVASLQVECERRNRVHLFLFFFLLSPLLRSFRLVCSTCSSCSLFVCLHQLLLASR